MPPTAMVSPMLGITKILYLAITVSKRNMKVLACFNCLKRPDWNFAFGLLCYYMLRRAEQAGDFSKVKNLLIYLNVVLLVFDFIWVLTMGIIWRNKPTHDASIWESFSGLHTFIITLSIINMVLRVGSLVTLFMTK